MTDFDPLQRSGKPGPGNNRSGSQGQGRMVAVAMPRYSRAIANADAADAYYRASLRSERVVLMRMATSLAIRCFNMLWCQALNARKTLPITHFAMLHDDICPEPGWLDILLDELDKANADVVSAVVPIKNSSGVTSTAVEVDGAPWLVRRLTMHEVFELPETFSKVDIAWRFPVDAPLLVNTGLWVCRFSSAWVEQLCFRDHTRVVCQPDGNFVCQDISEDWDFSRQLDQLGRRVFATRRVKLYHERPEFNTLKSWGTWKRDESYFDLMEKMRAGRALNSHTI